MIWFRLVIHLTGADSFWGIPTGLGYGCSAPGRFKRWTTGIVRDWGERDPSTGFPSGHGVEGMEDREMRIVSLVPSATELVAALGLQEALVGRSHECDYPAAVAALPICTYPKFDPHGSSLQIHTRVSHLWESSLSVYGLHLETLAALQPTHILTQAQCDVCAVSLTEVQAAVAAAIPSRPQVISLQPNTLSELWQDIRTAAQVLAVNPEPVITRLQNRVRAATTRGIPFAPTVVCLEWTDPLMNAGHWIPELVELAGGQEILGKRGQPSEWITWEDLLRANPDRIVVMPCGFSLPQTRQAVLDLSRDPRWPDLRAVQQDQVYLVDGNQYFNRPGPRLVDSLEIMAEILQGQPCRYPGSWERLGGRSYPATPEKPAST